MHVYNSISFVIFYVFWKMGGGGGGGGGANNLQTMEAEIYLHLHISQIVMIR